MTIASKTVLLQMRFVRAGAPFCSISAKTTVDATNFDFVDKGGSFYGVSNEITPPVYTYATRPVRQGAPFRWNVAKSSINGSYGFYNKGEPFYVSYNEEALVTFNTTRFFMLF